MMKFTSWVNLELLPQTSSRVALAQANQQPSVITAQHQSEQSARVGGLALRGAASAG